MEGSVVAVEPFLRVMASRDVRFWAGGDRPAPHASGNATGRKRARVDEADGAAVLDGGSLRWPCYRCETDKRHWTYSEVFYMNEQRRQAQPALQLQQLLKMRALLASRSV